MPTTHGCFGHFNFFQNSIITLIIIKTKHNSLTMAFFLPFYINFVINLKVTQGHHYN